MTDRDRAADRRLQRLYGVTLDEYNAILKHQEYRCAICGKKPEPGKPRLHLDHSHKHGLIRGILCFWCNKVLGMWQESIQKFEAAAVYLVCPPAIEVIGERYTVPGRIGSKKRARLLKKLAGGK